MLCPEVYPGRVWDRPKCLRDAGNEDPPQFRGKITPGGGAKVSRLSAFLLPPAPSFQIHWSLATILSHHGTTKLPAEIVR